MSILMVVNTTLNRTLDLFWDNSYNLAIGNEMLIAVIVIAFIVMLAIRSRAGFVVGSGIIMLTFLISDMFPDFMKVGVLIGGGVIWYMAIRRLVL